MLFFSYTTKYKIISTITQLINIIYLFNHCKYTIFSVTLHYVNEPLRCFYFGSRQM
nr:MAG TPA: hypothetical protein [Caudoviricetes sp.]